MKVNELTEESIKGLPATYYAIFNRESILLPIHPEIIQSDDFTSIIIGERWGISLEEIKFQFKDCEMFPIEQIKKPTGINNE